MSDPSILVLASASPRRQRLLELLGITHQVVPCTSEALSRRGEEPAQFAIRAAVGKALAVATLEPSLPVLAADTVVESGGITLGKPTSPAHAAAMLRRLSGRTHLVHTAVALAVDGRCESLLDSAEVTFAYLTDELITWYVATGEPMDKAGAYAIQGIGGLLVASMHGTPATVIGLPIHRLPELFATCGLDLLRFSRHA